MKQMGTVFFISIAAVLYSCTQFQLGGMGRKNLHDRYAKKLVQAGLKETAMGQMWLTAADQALKAPQAITLPYRQTGYFAADKPRAVGLQFTAPRGAKLIFRLDTKSLNTFTLYTDLWRAETDGDHKLLLSIDSTSGEFAYEVKDEGETYLLRLQPELLSSGEYTLSISVGPSLAFPVAGARARIGSVWGDPRDAGARSHEGIDIFAPHRTPVLAAADGIVHRVGDNRLGGKVIFMRPSGKNLSLYYAHLDEQLVSSGQRVSAGDTIGLVGNTGNARTTPPHLHFGIYALGGAIDPFVFVNPAVKRAGTVPVKAEELNTLYRTTRPVRLEKLTLERNTVLLATDAGTRGLVVQTPEGKPLMLPLNSTQIADNQINRIRVADTIPLLEAPLTTAPVKRKLLPGIPVRVHGFYNGFAFVSGEAQDEGWVLRAGLR